MKKTIPGLLLLALATTFAGLALANAEPEELPLAMVNEEPILTADLERQLGRIHESVDQMDRDAFATDRLMFKLINDVLIGQEARAAGMAEEPEIVAQLAEYRDELAFKYLEKIEIEDRVEPKPKAVKALFAEQYREMQLRVITSEEKATAETILEELRDGADMEALARERSVDHIRVRGGLMRSAPRIRLPRAVAEVAADLDVGELGGPVSTELGWTVFRVEAKSDADPAQFEDLEARMRSILRTEKARGLRAVLAKTARKHHDVVLDQQLIDKMTPERQPDARLKAKNPDSSAVVARIGKHRTVQAGDYARALDKRWKGVANEEAAIAAAPIILNGLVERELLVAEGKRRGYDRLPRVQALLRAKETRLLIPRYLEEVIASGIEVTEKEMTAYYEEHKNEFLQAPRVRLGQITVATLEEAEKVAGMLRGGADVAWVARQHSIDGYKEQGGLRDWMVLRPGNDALHDILLDTAAGDVLDPFGPEGNHIVLKMVAREEQGPFPFEQIAGNVRQAVFIEKSRAALDRYIKTLRERSEIVVYEDRVRALNLTGTFTEQAEEQSAPGGHGH